MNHHQPMKAIASRVQVYSASPFNSPSFLTLSHSAVKQPAAITHHDTFFLIIVMKSKRCLQQGKFTNTQGGSILPRALQSLYRKVTS